MKKCKFCKKKLAIENSHIIPSFIIKWVKDTSPTPYIRSSNEPNIRKQDGLKSPLLCPDCEEMFSKYEDEFKKNIFSKIANYRVPCPNKLNISKMSKQCIYSIAWRALANTYYYPDSHDYTEEEFNEFPKFLNKIKTYIENSESSIFKSYLIPCTKEVLIRTNLPKIDWIYYDRSFLVEARIWDNNERFIIFIKLPFMIILFEIISNNNDIWNGCNIEEDNPIELSSISSVPIYVNDLINFYFNSFLKSKKEVTSHQNKQIEKSQKTSNCGFFKSQNKK